MTFYRPSQRGRENAPRPMASDQGEDPEAACPSGPMARPRLVLITREDGGIIGAHTEAADPPYDRLFGEYMQIPLRDGPIPDRATRDDWPCPLCGDTLIEHGTEDGCEVCECPICRVDDVTRAAMAVIEWGEMHPFSREHGRETEQQHLSVRERDVVDNDGSLRRSRVLHPSSTRPRGLRAVPTARLGTVDHAVGLRPLGDAS